MATMQVGALVVDLVAESAKYVAELKKANKATTNWSQEVKKASSAVAKSLVAAGTAAAGALAAMYTVTASSIDEQAKFADKIGVTTDALAGLQHAGELTGVSTNTLNLGLQRMTRRVAEAAEGTGTASAALEELGLQAEQLNQLTPDEQFKAIADAMGEVENKSDKLRLAFKLFDSEGTALVNTLDLGAEGLEEITREAEAFGIALTRVDAQKVEDANDAFYRAGLLSKGFAKQLTVELAPIVKGVSEEFLNAANAAGGMGNVAAEAVDLIVQGLDVVYAGLMSLKNGWNVVKWATIEATRWAVEALRALEYDLKLFLNMLPGIELELSESLGRTLTTLRDESKKALDELTDSSYELADQLERVWNGSGRIKEITDDWRRTADETARATVETKQYNDALSNMSAGPDPKQLTEAQRRAQETALLSLQRDLGYQEQVIWESYRRQEAMINSLVLTEEQVRAAGFETQLELQRAYLARATKQRDGALEDLRKKGENFLEAFAESVRSTTQTFQSLWNTTFDRFASDFGDATADAILEGENFGDAMNQVAKGFARSMISALVEIGTKKLVLMALDKMIATSGAANDILRVTGDALSGVELSAINAFASTAAIPITGPALAPAAAASARAITMPMALSAIAAANSGLAGIAHAGMQDIPGDGTWLLKEHERVLSANQNRDLTNYLQKQQEVPVQQVVYSPTIVVEAGASQNQDQAFAQKIVDDVYNRLIVDGKTNGPVRRAMNG